MSKDLSEFIQKNITHYGAPSIGGWTAIIHEDDFARVQRGAYELGILQAQKYYIEKAEMSATESLDVNFLKTHKTIPIF